jgi:hypothetical protein
MPQRVSKNRNVWHDFTLEVIPGLLLHCKMYVVLGSKNGNWLTLVSNNQLMTPEFQAANVLGSCIGLLTRFHHFTA